jgi:TolB protein
MTNPRRERSRVLRTLVLALSLPVLLASLWAEELPPEVHLKLTEQGSTRMAIGLQLFLGPEGTEEIGRAVIDVVRDDLEFSLYFDVIDAGEGVDTTAKGFELFGAMGASALVRLRPVLGDVRNSITLRIYDVPTRRQVTGLEFAFTDPRRVGHRISDEVVKVLTGSVGIFRTRLAFSLSKGEDKEIALCDYDGKNLRVVTQTGGLKLFPKWEDPKHLVYSQHADALMRLVRADFDEGVAQTIQSAEGFFVAGEFSPDRRTLACAMSRSGNPEIYLIDLKSEELERLTVNGAVDISPTWSPNGRELAFVSDRSGSPQIYVMDVDGGNVRRLSYEGYYNTSPRWSPAGDFLAYTSQDPSGRHQIFTIDANGENPVQLTHLGSNEEPSWSPDGLHLVFTSDRSGTRELYVMHWDGSGQRRITGTGGAFHPDWGPTDR